MHALWALQKMKLEHLVPDLKHLLEQDFTWWEDYYPPGLELLPIELRDTVENNLKLNLKKMRDFGNLTNINLFSD